MTNLGGGMSPWVAGLYGGIAAFGAATDYRKGKIHNWLTFPAILLGLALGAWRGADGLSSAAAGLGMAAVLFVPLFYLGILGGGDVKLIMALGTVLGFRGTLELAAATILVAGAGSAALLVKHRRVGYFMRQFWLFLRSLFVPGLELQWPKLSREIKAPFGIAVFIGFVVVIARGEL